MRYSKIEGDSVVNVDSIALPVNLVFRPTYIVEKLDVYNKNQFRRDSSGLPYYDGAPTAIKVGDIIKVVSKQDNVNGKNYWFTEGGLMIPKESGFFKLTDDQQNVNDAIPDYAPEIVEEKSNVIPVEKFLAIQFGYPLLAGVLLGFVGYKLASKYKKSKALFVMTGIATGITAGSYISKFHFKKVGFSKQSETLKQMKDCIAGNFTA